MLNNNEYFDGNVKSISFQTETLPASVGVMAIGEYTFDTSQRETMTVVSGSMSIQMPGSDTTTTYQAGDSFEVAADSSFNVSVSSDTAYLCVYG